MYNTWCMHYGVSLSVRLNRWDATKMKSNRWYVFDAEVKRLGGTESRAINSHQSRDVDIAEDISIAL